MRRYLLPILAVLLLLLTGGRVSAQEATPVGGAGSVEDGESLLLAEAQLSDLPSPAFIGLVRFTFPAGSATPEGADPGAVVASIESGNLTATIDGLATITRHADPGTPPAAAAGQDLVLQQGDAVTIPAGTSSSFRNEGQEVATALVVMVFPEDPFGPFAQTSLDGVDAELLAGGMVEMVPSPAIILLSRERFAPGESLPPAESLGPVLGAIEAGSLTYVVESGESTITRGGRMGTPTTGERTAEAATPGSESVLEPGDGFIEEGGTVSGARNDGDDPAELLVVLVWPPEAFAPQDAPGMATPTS